MLREFRKRKSSLVIDTLYPVLRNRLNNSRMQEGIYDDISGLENLDNVIVIDQSPIEELQDRIRRHIPGFLTTSGIFLPNCRNQEPEDIKKAGILSMLKVGDVRSVRVTV